jgi:RTA1 like protein
MRCHYFARSPACCTSATAAAAWRTMPSRCASLATVPTRLELLISLIAFLAAASVTIVLNVKTRTRFTWIVTITAVLEMVGYAARFQMIRSPSLGNYVIMQSLLVITPTLLAVAIYVVVGKLMMLADSQQMGCLKASRIGTIFSLR